MSKVDMHFMCEETKLWTLFTSPRQLNTEFSSYASDELEDLPPILIMVKTEGLGYLPPCSLWNTEGLEI